MRPGCFTVGKLTNRTGISIFKIIEIAWRSALPSSPADAISQLYEFKSEFNNSSDVKIAKACNTIFVYKKFHLKLSNYQNHEILKKLIVSSILDQFINIFSSLYNLFVLL